MSQAIGSGGREWTRRSVMAAAAGGAMAGGCGRRPGRAALGFWAMGYEGDYAPHLTEAFTRATGLAVDVQSLPWTAAHEKLLTAYAAGTLPDVFMLPNGWVGEFAMAGAIAPVADRALLDGLLPGLAGTTRFAGESYAIPWSLAPQMQFYRRDLLAAAGYAAPPADWAGWREMALALKRRRPADYAVLLYLNWWDTLFTFAGQTGVPLLRDRDTRGNFTNPAFREALAFYVSLFADGLAPRALSTEIEDPFAAFAQGLFALYPCPPWLLLDLKRRAAELPCERWGVTRMPGPRGPGPASSTSGSIVVSRTTARLAEAWALARHLVSPASELRFQQMIGNLPAARAAWDMPAMRTPLLKPFAAQVAAPSTDPAIVEWERIRIEVQLVAERVVRGLATIDEGLAEMDRRADRLLDRRRALVAAGRLT